MLYWTILNTQSLLRHTLKRKRIFSLIYDYLGFTHSILWTVSHFKKMCRDFFSCRCGLHSFTYANNISRIFISILKHGFFYIFTFIPLTVLLSDTNNIYVHRVFTVFCNILCKHIHRQNKHILFIKVSKKY